MAPSGLGAFAKAAASNPASPYASWYKLDPSQRDPDASTGLGRRDRLPELDKASPAWRPLPTAHPIR
jgi:hypothetical protein